MAGIAPPKLNFNTLSPISKEHERKVIANLLKKGFSTSYILRTHPYTKLQISRVKKRLKDHKSLRYTNVGGGKSKEDQEIEKTY